jgi:hypothetical protein
MPTESKLSRRSLVTGAAALPALAMPTVAVVVDPSDAQLEALSLEVLRAWAAYDQVDADDDPAVGCGEWRT